MLSEAYIGIGSNLGESKAQCETAIRALNYLPKTSVVNRSSLYRTEPLGIKNQNWFINAVVEIETSLEPFALLKALLDIEMQMGRVRKEKWGSRVIDLDLLLYDDKIIHQPGLQIPHPEIHNRAFVLVPLCEIRQEAIHPLLNKTAVQMLEALPTYTSPYKLISST